MCLSSWQALLPSCNVQGVGRLPGTWQGGHHCSLPLQLHCAELGTVGLYVSLSPMQLLIVSYVFLKGATGLAWDGGDDQVLEVLILPFLHFFRSTEETKTCDYCSNVSIVF